MSTILSRIQEISTAEGITIGSMERSIGASKGVLSRAISNGTDIQSKWIQKVVEKYPQYSPGWLLTGEGNMLKAKQAVQVLVPTPKAIVPSKHSSKNDKKGIPLISQTAMAGYFAGEEDADINAYDYFVIPSFKNVDFLIRISGDSMEPTYRSGDIVACQVVPIQDIFFQWNRPYIIDTNQGALLKRIRQGEDNDHLLIVSDNPEYPPFQLHKSHFYHVALVKGIVRAE